MEHDEQALIIRIPLKLLRELAGAEPTGAASTEQTRGRDPDERLWSSAQKRLLYRLLQRRGHHGQMARRYLEDALGLAPGEAPTMRAASRLIDELQAGEGGGRGAA
ncbi:MAG: hypothetical protein CMN31_10705 [Sandaracinus sp.]|mgnify:CR=1 FL=1|nr:hypothetical protein [Sandaracinus sp.]MBJ71793.1 hypothetical protein [Sandaracinus sp.]HJK91987.1 hypothetical protein [Polyangiaceae bacterium LLY-WYZ-15_(1-7)]HJL22372.1 hypothetical protein [Polyangiaceae bacterium LLY-WYZ-15_(1-7)]HJL32456.1 hypothetical protein [Polyangiaceae bacterium LLY-WYZ-15_(1-7)]